MNAALPAIEPVSPLLGATVTGLDLAQPLSDTAFATVEQALHAHGYIVFPQQSIGTRAFVDFARRWGRPEPHVIDTFHHPDDANVLILSNVRPACRPACATPAPTSTPPIRTCRNRHGARC